MSFFQTSDGESIDSTTEFEASTSFEPMPEGSEHVAIIDEARWDDYQDDEYINLRWEIVGNGEYNGRRLFQKIRVKDDESKKRDKALRMLAAIDANCGGGLMKLGTEPADYDLATNLTNKPMRIKLGVWDQNGKNGNWVMAVSASNKPKTVEPATDINDDIPF